MREIDNGGPAFPSLNAEFTGIASDGQERYDIQPSGGMTLRDYFAAKQMPVVYSVAVEEAKQGSGLFQHDDWRIGLALDAYKLADAMIQARKGGANE